MNYYLIIGRESCPFCLKAKELLDKKKLEFVFVDFEKSRAVLEQMKTMTGFETVPIIWQTTSKSQGQFMPGMNQVFIGGYDDLVLHLSKL